MAISNNITTENSQYGVKFDGAYYRIVTASVSRQRDNNPKFQVVIDLAAYATNSPSADTREVDFKRFEADLDTIEAAAGSKFLDKCYAWVMTQMAGSSAV